MTRTNGKQRQQTKNKLKLKLKKNHSACVEKKVIVWGSTSFLLDRDTFIQFIFAVILSLFRCFLVSCFSNTRAEPDQTRRAREKKLRNGDLCLRNCITITKYCTLRNLDRLFGKGSVPKSRDQSLRNRDLQLRKSITKRVLNHEFENVAAVFGSLFSNVKRFQVDNDLFPGSSFSTQAL